MDTWRGICDSYRTNIELVERITELVKNDYLETNFDRKS